LTFMAAAVSVAEDEPKMKRRYKFRIGNNGSRRPVYRM
jgi:hypothetical protein